MTSPVTPPHVLRHLVVGTDFSPAAAAGLAWARSLAATHGAIVHVVHALRIYGPPSDFLVSPPDVSEEIQAAALSRLEGVVAGLRHEGLEATQEFRMGTPSAALVEAAATLDADLLVVGTRGATGLEHLLLGSTAQRVVEHAPCPVLAVHPGQEPPAHGICHLLVPTDFSHDAERAVAAALTLLPPSCPGELRLTLLHAYHLPIEYTAYGTIPTSPHYLADAASAAEERLAELAATLGRPGLTVEVTSAEGYPPEAILAQARELRPDLIAMGTHGRSGLEHLLLGSTAERVVQRSPCPVLTVRRQAER